MTMTLAASAPHPSSFATTRAAFRGEGFVRRWLMLVAVLVALMVVVGGATRLTGSGLSITEWRPVTGAIPPLSASAWASEFEKYRQSPQYELLNKGMTLSEFQFIYAWEWGHRQLGRLIGLVFLAGLIWIAVRRLAPPRWTLGFFGMGLLLGLQGLVGWIMVASGLEPGMTAVAPVKLTLHLVFACLFFASLLVALARLGAFGPGIAAASGWRWGAAGLVVLTFVQIALGGLVAGSKAGFTYNTWPLMDGAFIPPAKALFSVTPLWENLVDNVVLVQLNHRLGAYLLLAAALAYAFAARRSGSPALRRISHAVAGLVLVQAILGIATLVLAVPLWAGLVHQAFALAVLGAATVQVVRLTAPA